MKRFLLSITLLVAFSSFSIIAQRNITEEEWDELPVDKPVVLEFYANWCAPCRTQGPIVSRMAQEFPGISFYKVNIEQEKDWFSYETKDGAIPMIQFYYLADPRNGRYYKSTIGGFMPEYELRDSCRAILNRYNELYRKNHLPQRASTSVTDTIVEMYGVQYKLALTGVVDMGTGLLWAACNLDANRPEQSGGYYSWGETQEKNTYSWEVYKYANYNPNTDKLTITKYNLDQDRDRYLKVSDDVVTQKMGGKWRMPDRGELNDLLWGCEWDDFVFRGVRGLLAYNKETKNALFFPLAGCKTHDGLVEQGVTFNIWSLELSNTYNGYSLVFDPNEEKFSIASWDRCFGFSIRPVYGNY